jgi:HEAT repeat protein
MARQLLIALCQEEDRSRRRLLFDFLKQGSAAIVEDARLLLADSRWFVVRNMIALLHAMGARSATGDLRRCLEHSDARVRIEALRALSELDRDLPAALVGRLLADDDPKVAEKMAQLAGNFAGGTEPLLALVAPLDPFGRQRGLRVKALLALGELGDPQVLPRIKRFFGSMSIDPLEERRAAFQSLAGYPVAARRDFVTKGLSSRDPEIRATCERLRGDDRG